VVDNLGLPWLARGGRFNFLPGLNRKQTKQVTLHGLPGGGRFEFSPGLNRNQTKKEDQIA